MNHRYIRRSNITTGEEETSRDIERKEKIDAKIMRQRKKEEK
jgi:hypothetical protein